MKILISSKGKQVDSNADKRFARAECFAVYNTDSNEYTFIDNNAKDGAHGAGPKAAQTVIDLSIDVLITGNLGPRALAVIENTNIKSYRINGNTIDENVKNYLDGKLEEISSAGPSHVGI
ncbi:MAG: NifB/NifX family molybdenum-iron cluster-binding protein [Bacillota bacterium]|nr:NifB/NifX family molybdenum-iron cluster-binding protein [Bacillota bacterium]